MSVRLQQFEHDQSVYDRPNRTWVCGHAADGRACPMGPDARGTCRTQAECRPQQRGDRWMCTRAAADGGPCEDGPRPDGTCCRKVTPCQPVRSHRARRGLLVRLSVAATVGALLVLIGAKWEPSFVSPGPLAANHAGLQHHCRKCHTAMDSGLVEMLAASFAPPSASKESGMCLGCHNLGDHPLAPHSGAAGCLPSLSCAFGDPPLRARLPAMVDPAANGAAELACATCHREHQGRLVDLTRLTGDRCQSCHRTKFHSFSEGHPAFSATWPAKRPTRIAFSHRDHLLQHFPDQEHEVTCVTCHVQDSNGARMLLRGFDQTCGSCHAHRRQIGDPEKSIAVFGLPSIDRTTFETRRVSIGSGRWPDRDEYVDLSEFMRMLLSLDEGTGRDLKLLDDAGVRLTNLGEATDEQILAAARVVWSVQRLIRDLSGVEGEAHLESLLRAALGSDLTAAEVSALTGEMPDVTLAAHETWRGGLERLRAHLPDLDADLDAYVPGELSIAPKPAPVVEPVPAAEPAADEGDPFAEEDDEDDPFAEEDPFAEADAEDPFAEADDEADDPFAEEAQDPFAENEEDDPFAEEDDPGVSEPAPDTEPVVERPPPDPLEGQTWSHWFYDRFAVRYRPSGHADAFVRAWLDRTAARGGPVFEALSKEDAAGRCARCHTVETVDTTPIVNWLAARPAPGERRITEFVHRPHFNFDGYRDCVSCHALDTLDEGLFESFASDYLGTGRREFCFAPISKSTCVECHDADGAGQGCLTCHSYHVGTFPPTLTPPSFGHEP